MLSGMLSAEHPGWAPASASRLGIDNEVPEKRWKGLRHGAYVHFRDDAKRHAKRPQKRGPPAASITASILTQKHASVRKHRSQQLPRLSAGR